MHPRKWTHVHTKTGQGMFLVPLFVIVQGWNQPEIPLTNDWIKKVAYLYNIVLCSDFENMCDSWLFHSIYR